MLQYVGKLREAPRACVYLLAAEWQLKSSRRMAGKLAANNSLLTQKDSGLWLQMLIQNRFTPVYWEKGASAAWGCSIAVILLH